MFSVSLFVYAWADPEGGGGAGDQDLPGKSQVAIGFLKNSSTVLSWDRKSYLTHTILPRLSREGCRLAKLELTHMVVK